MTTSQKYETHLFSYQHNGSRWALDIKATSPEDAKARLAKMANASYDGVLVASVGVPEGFVRRLLRLFIR